MQVFGEIFGFLSKSFSVMGYNFSFLSVFIVGAILSFIGWFVGELFG